MTTQRFEKPAQTAEALLNLCGERGLIINSREEALRFIRFTGYYRLSGYMLPFQEEHRNGGHNFTAGTRFEDISELYVFDRKLRLLVIDAIERIEIASRSIVSDTMSLACGPHWFMDESNFKDSFDHQKLMNEIEELLKTAGKRHAFLSHYVATYSDPAHPPSWMLFEALSFGAVSKIYSGLKTPHRKNIAGRLDMKHENLASWLHTATALRNICAHHSRLWNRIFGVRPKKEKTHQQHFENNDRFYAQAVTVKILLEKIAPDSFWAESLKNLLDEFPKIPQRSMGFPKGWETSDFWSSA